MTTLQANDRRAHVWPAGQHNRPNPERLWAELQGIFEREYYTESGPLVRQLERRLSEAFGVANAVCVSNPSVAWTMLLEAAEVTGQDVLLPVTAPARLIEGLAWAGCTPQWCGVDPSGGAHLKVSDVRRVCGSSSAAVIGVHEWGGSCDIDGISHLASERGLVPLFDASSSLSVHTTKGPLAARGRASVLALQAEHLIDAANGAVIITGDADIADRLRCMRSSGGVQRRVTVRRTVNGRMSEAQAAQALVLLDDLPQILRRNTRRYEIYRNELQGLQGAVWLTGHGVVETNHEQVVLMAAGGEQAQRIRQAVRQTGRSLPIPFDYAAELPPEVQSLRQQLASRILLLPIADSMSDESLRELICAIRQAWR